MTYSKVCAECVLNGDCLLQKDDCVEQCDDVAKAEETANG